jgi:hypothetical protein
MKSFSPSRPGAVGRSRLARLAVAGLVTAGAFTAVPIAQADTLASVRSHVHGADDALHRVAAAGGAVAGPLGDLEAQLRAAGRGSSKLYAHAHSPVARVRAASALTKLAAQQSRDAATLTPLLGQLSGASQVDLASFVAAVTQGREQALTLVTGLIGQLPASVQGQVAGVVAALSGAGTGQVGAIAGAISPGSIACPATDAVSQVVATVLTSVQADLTRVQSILTFLPAGAASQLTGVLDGLPAQLNALVASLKQAFDCPSTTPVTGAGAPAGGIGSVVGSAVGVVGSVIGSIIQLVESLLSSFLPGIGAGQTPPPTTVPAPVSGLVGQVSPFPSFSGFFGSFFGGSGGGGLPGLGF